MGKTVYVLVEDEFSGERIRDIPVSDTGMDVIMYQPKSGIIIGTALDTKRTIADLQRMQGVKEAMCGEELRTLLEARMRLA